MEPRPCGGVFFLDMKLLSILFAVLISIGLLGAVILKQHPVPDSILPWAPLSIDHEINLLSEYKISKFKNDALNCAEFLSNSDVEFTSLADRQAGTCELENQVQISQSLYPYSNPLTGQCALMAAVAIWEKQVVQTLARKHFDNDVAQIQHYGIFSCRNIRGSSSRRSQHASANAIDIAGFRLKNGVQISVLKDWGKDSEKGQFLKEMRDQSCSVFKGVLGPDYNKLHADHFHLDLGPYNICQ